MVDTPTQTDDAPLSASKRSGAVDEATSQMVDAKGSSIVGRSVTINKPAEELFSYFRDFSNLPHFMENVVSIDVLDNKRSHWVVKAPAGGTVEWDARVTEEENGKSIAWMVGNHTLPPEKLDHSRVPKNWQEDLLLPRQWDANGHARNIFALSSTEASK